MIGAKSKWLLGTTAAWAFVASMGAAPALAQDESVTTTAGTAAAPGDVVEDEGLVVTGSRIRRSEFVTASPVQILTTEESKLQGLTDAASILQQSTIAAGSVQLNNQFSPYVVDGGSGINSISLRGLGAQRTLVLLNGRRLNPAGVSGTVAAVDLNVIPAALIDRFEVLKDGASSIYGSDAIAGAVNIITKDDVDGATLDLTGAWPVEEGGGDTYDVAISGGVVRDRWHVMGGLEYYSQSGIKQGDRSWGRCPGELQHAPGVPGNGYGRVYADGSPYCNYPQVDYVDSLISGGTRIFDPTSPGDGIFNPAGWTDFAQDPFPTDPRVTNIPTTDEQLQAHVLAPVERWGAVGLGSFDINGSTELYFEGLLTLRKSRQNAYVPVFFADNLDDIFLIADNPFTPPFISPVFDDEGNPVFDEDDNLLLQPDIVQPVVGVPVSRSSQEVWAGRAVVGIQGELGLLTDWRYDVAFTYGKSSADYVEHPRLTNRVRNALDVVDVEDVTGTVDPTLTRFNALDGATYTCAINVTNPDERCYPLDWFVGTAAFRNDPALAYITSVDEGHTDYEQYVLNAYIDGPLFQLPAGAVNAVLGVEYRHDELEDVPGPEAVARNYYGQSTAGITAGEETVKEIFVELEAPLLKGLPFVESLTVNVSDRYTSYDTAGNDNTYKLAANWQVVPSFRMRAAYGTSFRGPALFENYLAELLAFTSAIDPCQRYGEDNDPGDSLYDNCASEGLPENWVGYSQTPDVYSIGALGRLDPETSKNFTAGIIWQPSFLDFQLVIDYFNITVENEIAQLGAPNILDLCYTSQDFRNGSPYCTLISERDEVGDIGRIDDSYLNIAEQRTEGWDVTVQYNHELPIGELQLDWTATYTTVDKQELIEGSGFDNFNGTIGDPKVVWNAQATFIYKDWKFFWDVDYIGPTSYYSYLGEDPISQDGRYKLHNEPTTYHTFSTTYEADTWKATAGFRNIFDEQPPSVSNSPYTAFVPNAGEATIGPYDFFGRTFFINFQKDF